MQGHPVGCKCMMCQGKAMCGGMCMGMCGGHWARVIIKIVVALFIFWCGVQVGEHRLFRHQYYDYNGMMGGGWDTQTAPSNYGAAVMMSGVTGVPVPPPTATSTRK